MQENLGGITFFWAVWIWGAETFFQDGNGGARTFLQNRIGGANTFFTEQNGGQRLFLDRKITDFPGDVPVNFGHSLMFFRPSLGIFLIFYCS